MPPEVSATRPAGGRRPRIAVVIGSGGLKCAAAAGMYRVLKRHGVEADLAVGCSGGALYAAFLAMGLDVAAVERHTLSLEKDLLRKLHLRSLSRGLLARWFGFNERFGLVNDRRLNAFIGQMFGDRRLEDCRIPLHLVATDFHSGQTVDLSRGLLRDAARASIAIPLMLRPWPVAGRLLMDGGTSDPLPISVAIREGADIILAMGFETAPAPHLRSPAHLAGQAISITTNHLLRATYAFYSAVHHAEIVPLMADFERPIHFTDTHLIPELMDLGERLMEAEMPYLRRVLARWQHGVPA